MDINLFRKEGGQIDLLKESQRRRGKPIEDIDEVTRLDDAWRQLRHKLDLTKKESHDLSKSFQTEKDANKKAELVQKGKELKNEIAPLEDLVSKALADRDEKLYSIGNLVHDCVPVSNDEANNKVLKNWGTCRPSDDTLQHHHVLLWRIGGCADPEIGSQVAGHRGFYLTGPGMLLNNALVQYGLHFLASRKYTPVQTPFFMKQSCMKKVAALSEFHEALYKVTGNEEDEPMYLIATSEQPICALNMNQSFSKKDLPIKYAGMSTCFRKEAGKHGKDAWGIFRVHQFEKIEQFVVCHPDHSWEMQKEMMAVSEEFYQSLELAYHVVDIVSGELNNAAARKMDLEAWFPTLGVYRELVSCSNCTDYQSRRLNIKFNSNTADDARQQFVHLLNSTLCATERALCCILENYQTDKGIRIPTVLKPYLSPFLVGLEDPDIIPFVKDAPLIAKGGKGQAKKEKLEGTKKNEKKQEKANNNNNNNKDKQQEQPKQQDQ